MRILWALVVVACSSSPKQAPRPADKDTEPPTRVEPVAPPVVKAPEPVVETLAADTPKTTVAGNTFLAPAGWKLTVKGAATILEAPEGDSWVAFVDVQAKEPDDAVAQAWAVYKPDRKWPPKPPLAAADKDGWQDVRTYGYQTSPDERRGVWARTMRHGMQWMVVVYDVATPTRDKRNGNFALIFDRLLPKGYVRETFAGRKARTLDAARIDELGAFITRAQTELGVPGVSLGIVQDGKTVFTGGFGVRELGKPAKVDADTLYIIASNTKAMTTLMLGKLVDESKLAWTTQVTTLLPQFKLGDADTTSKVAVKHLICACTGMPRQDMEWLLEFKNGSADTTLASLAKMQPTSKFGEMYQYSNPLAAAAGFIGGHVAFPRLELGAAYDQAMQTRVFNPLGMTSTTFDFKRALRANHASAHGLDIDAKVAAATFDVNYSMVPMRPAGGAWSNVKDVLKYVSMELANGLLPGGKRYIAEATLLERRAPQVAIGRDATYGMGLSVDNRYGTAVVQHGGSMIGYKSNMFWLPEHNVGVVILTNGDAGGTLNGLFQRKLLEVLFDGNPEADNDLAAGAKAMRERIAVERKLLTVPADKTESAKLAAKYTHPALGELRVVRDGDVTTFDFGEWKSPVATKRNPDGALSFVLVATGVASSEFVPRETGGKRTLVVRAGQHEYVFTEA